MDERDLWALVKEKGDGGAREEIILRYMYVVRYVAGRMAMHVPSNIELDDLTGWGVLGLLDAVEKYDPVQEIKFSTYAAIRVRGEILDHIRSLDWAPRSLRTMARKVGAARDKLRHQLGSEPEPEQIARMLGASVEKVEDTMAQLKAVHLLNLDDFLPAEDRSEGRRLDLVTDDRQGAPDQALLQKEKEDLLVQAIQKLPESQQKVLHLYYYEQLTLKEIGVVLEVTESRICQIHTAAMKRLRKALKGDA